MYQLSKLFVLVQCIGLFLSSLQRNQIELNSLRPQYETVRHQLEAETLKRAEVENQLQTLKEQLTFAHNLHRTVSNL